MHGQRSLQTSFKKGFNRSPFYHEIGKSHKQNDSPNCWLKWILKSQEFRRPLVTDEGLLVVRDKLHRFYENSKRDEFRDVYQRVGILRVTLNLVIFLNLLLAQIMLDFL